MAFIRFIALLLLLALPLAAPAGPSNEADYEKASGLVDIPNGSYVEGSHRQGGVQPDYHIDYSHPEIKRLLAHARKVAKEEPEYWPRVQRLLDYIRSWHLPNRDYESPNYVKLNKKYKKMGADVPLGEYSACRSGVCRENALLLHAALKEAGIPNYHAYAQIRRASRFHNYDLVEDHGFVVAEHQGKHYVLDSYYVGFNGYLLEDLMSKEGITPKSEMAPVASEFVGYRRILKINQFPTVWVPKLAGKPKTLDISASFPVPVYESCQNYYREFSGY